MGRVDATTRPLSTYLATAAAASAGAGLVHAAAAGGHSDEPTLAWMFALVRGRATRLGGPRRVPSVPPARRRRRAAERGLHRGLGAHPHHRRRWAVRVRRGGRVPGLARRPARGDRGHRRDGRPRRPQPDRAAPRRARHRCRLPPGARARGAGDGRHAHARRRAHSHDEGAVAVAADGGHTHPDSAGASAHSHAPAAGETPTGPIISLDDPRLTSGAAGARNDVARRHPTGDGVLPERGGRGRRRLQVDRRRPRWARSSTSSTAPT